MEKNNTKTVRTFANGTFQGVIICTDIKVEKISILDNDIFEDCYVMYNGKKAVAKFPVSESEYIPATDNQSNWIKTTTKIHSNSPLMHRDGCLIDDGKKTLESMVLDVLQDPNFREPDRQGSEDYKMFSIWEEKVLKLIAHIADEIKGECIYEGQLMGGKMEIESDVFQGYATILDALASYPNEDGVRKIKQLFGDEDKVSEDKKGEQYGIK